MKEPDFTCPDKEEIEEIFKEILDTSVVNDEIDTLVVKLKAEYKEQYEFYIGKILVKLDKYKDSVCNVRDWGQEMEKENKKLKEIIHNATGVIGEAEIIAYLCREINAL